MPIIEIREIACMARTTVNVAPRAPYCGPGILDEILVRVLLGGSRYSDSEFAELAV